MGRQERPGVYKAFSQPMYMRASGPIMQWNHVMMLRNENLLLGTKIQCRSRRTFVRNRSEVAAENILWYERQGDQKGLIGTNLWRLKKPESFLTFKRKNIFQLPKAIIQNVSLKDIFYFSLRTSSLFKFEKLSSFFNLVRVFEIANFRTSCM